MELDSGFLSVLAAQPNHIRREGRAGRARYGRKVPTVQGRKLMFAIARRLAVSLIFSSRQNRGYQMQFECRHGPHSPIFVSALLPNLRRRLSIRAFP